MRDYAVVANIKAEQKGIIDDVFDKGYEQGYHDGKLDGEAEKIEKLEKQFDDEKKAEYKRGYEQGRMSTLTIKDFEEIRRSQYDRGYKDACNDKDLITCKKSDELSDKAYKDGYNKGIHEVLTIDIFEGIKLAEYNKGYGAGYKDAYEVGKKDGQKAERMLLHEPLIKDLEEAYQKGLKHGQELRAEEVTCAEACGMKRAWDVARKILSRHGEGYDATDREVFGTDDVFSLSASEAVAKLEEWEKKQKENEKVDCNNTDCKNCINHNDCDYEDEWKLRRRGIVPAPPKEKQSEKSCKDCKYFYHGCHTLTCDYCKDFSLFEHKKEEQTEKNCENCKYNNREKTSYPCAACLRKIDGRHAMWEEKEDYVRDPTPEESKSVNDYIKSISEETGVTFNEKEEQTTTLCRKCIHAHNMHGNILTCDAVPCVIVDGHCDKYEEKQEETEKNVESIAVWDEVEDNLGNRMVITHIYSDDKYADADVIDADGRFRCMPLELLEKTGRHFCFQELLNAMKKDDVEEAETNENK